MMEDIGTFISLLIQGILNTFSFLSSIEFLGTDLLSIMIAFVIANSLISLFIVVNNSNVRVGKGEKRKNEK